MIAPIIIHFLFIGTLAVFCSIWWWSWSHRIVRTTITPKRFRPAHLFTARKEVAVICATLTPAVKRLLSGLNTALKRSTRNIRYTITIYQGKKRSKRTRDLVHSIMKKKASCLVTTDLFSTQIAQDILAHHDTPLPLIFGLIHACENHIIQHPVSHLWTTGVLTQRNLQKELSRLIYLTPRVKHATIIRPSEYSHWADKEYKQISSFLQKNQSTFECMQIDAYSTADIVSSDLVILMNGAASPAQIALLAELCQRYGTALCATNIDDVLHGAGVGTGGGEKSIGTQIGSKVVTLIEQNTPPHHIPWTYYTPRHRICINHKTAPLQSIFVSKNDLFVIGRGETTRNEADRIY